LSSITKFCFSLYFSRRFHESLIHGWQNNITAASAVIALRQMNDTLNQNLTVAENRLKEKELQVSALQKVTCLAFYQLVFVFYSKIL
jgi:hypothetical protein